MATGGEHPTALPARRSANNFSAAAAAAAAVSGLATAAAAAGVVAAGSGAEGAVQEGREEARGAIEKMLAEDKGGPKATTWGHRGPLLGVWLAVAELLRR